MPDDPARPLRMGWREWGLLVSLSLLWGGSFFFNGVAVRDLPVFSIVLARIGIASLLLWAGIWLSGTPVPQGWRIWALLAATGILNTALPFSLIVWAQTQIPSGLASILNATTPMFAVIVAHLFTVDEKMTAGRFAGVVIGFGGVALMLGADINNLFEANLVAQLACLGAALCYSVGAVASRIFVRAHLPPLTMAAAQLGFATLFLMPLVMVIDRPWTLVTPSVAAIGAVLGIAVLSTALAYIVYFRLITRAGATNALLVTLLVPVTAIILGITFLDESLLFRHVAGLLAIGLGLAAIDGRLVGRLRRWPGGPVGGDPE